ncbi:MAG TPA: nucleotidyltransferase domain-containing protein [Thermomicrobiales bacterium]|nr:nucleotidyltransferase domain-containing protein [Thermomicrobiales bacterium]
MNQPPPLPRARLVEVLRAFKEQRAVEYHLTALGHFGSYARDEARVDSDIDIVFDTDMPNLFLTAMLKQDLEAWLGRPVDVLQARGLTNARLRERIEREAVYV